MILLVMDVGEVMKDSCFIVKDIVFYLMENYIGFFSISELWINVSEIF